MEVMIFENFEDFVISHGITHNFAAWFNQI